MKYKEVRAQCDSTLHFGAKSFDGFAMELRGHACHVDQVVGVNHQRA